MKHMFAPHATDSTPTPTAKTYAPNRFGWCCHTPRRGALRAPGGRLLREDEEAAVPMNGTFHERLGHVSTKGGPLLVTDLEVAKEWAGALGDDAEYERACELFEANPAAPGGQVEVASVLGATAVIWDMPTGTADVWRREPDFLVVARSWLDDSDRRAEFLASLPPENPVLLGGFKLNSGWAVIMWAADSGEDPRGRARRWPLH